MEKKARQDVLSNLELAAFCGQMAMVLKAGISAADGVSMMREDAQSSKERELLDKICEKTREREALSAALEEVGAFPAHLCKMARIGEETGTSDDVFSSLERYYERQEGIAFSIRNALTYPLIMIGMMAIVVAVLLTKVMPVFRQAFRQLGMEMSGFSKGALLLGNALSRHAAVFAVSILMFALFFAWLVKTKEGRARLARLGRRFWLTREISDKAAACRFAGGMALALKSGLTLERGLELAQELNEDKFFAEKLSGCQKMLNEGKSLSDALREGKIFTGVYARMADIAGRTGVMDEMMGKLADRLEEEVDGEAESLISMLEPTLVIALSLIAGAILLSVMLPLMGILAGI